MPESKDPNQFPQCFNRLLAMLPDPNPLIDVVGAAGTFRVDAGRGIDLTSIGKVALVDFERNKADLREFLPRPIGRIVAVFPDKTCDVQMGFDPYAENREALAKLREFDDELDDLTEEQDKLLEQLEKLTGDLAAEREEKTVLEAQVKKLRAEKQKLDISVHGVLLTLLNSKAPQLRVHDEFFFDVETQPYVPGRTAPFPTVMNSHPFSSHPFSFFARSYAAPKPVPHVVQCRFCGHREQTRSTDCPYLYPSKEAADKAIQDAHPGHVPGYYKLSWIAVPYNAAEHGFPKCPEPQPVPERGRLIREDWELKLANKERALADKQKDFEAMSDDWRVTEQARVELYEELRSFKENAGIDLRQVRDEAARERKAAETACAETMKLRAELEREQSKNRNQVKIIKAYRSAEDGLNFEFVNKLG